MSAFGDTTTTEQRMKREDEMGEEPRESLVSAFGTFVLTVIVLFLLALAVHLLT